MKKHQAGFGVIEGLLLVVLVGLIGFIGWFVWHSQQSADQSYDNASNTSLSKTAGSTPPATNYFTDPTIALWNTGSLPTEKLSFKYPSSWKLVVKHYAKDSGPGASNDGDTATLTAPNGFVLNINTGNGSAGDYNNEKAEVFYKESFTLNDQPVLAVITGQHDAAKAQNVEASSLDRPCDVNCRLTSKNSSGTIAVYGGYYDAKAGLNRSYDPAAFKDSGSVKIALSIVESLSY